MIENPIDATRFYLNDITVPYVFTDGQIQEFLDQEKVIDSDGYDPSDITNWTPTYDVMRAAGRGWLWLASTGRVISYRIGDTMVQFDRTFCRNRGMELMGAGSSHAQRRDEQTEPDTLARFREET